MRRFTLVVPTLLAVLTGCQSGSVSGVDPPNAESQSAYSKLSPVELASAVYAMATMSSKSALGGMDAMPLVSDGKSRQASPENFTGEPNHGAMSTEGTGKGPARDLGVGWKVSPSINVRPHTTAVLADLTGPGRITHVWITGSGDWQRATLRAAWDNEAEPSVVSPIGAFFCSGLGTVATLSSSTVTVTPKMSFNCYWPMPFRKSAKLTYENVADKTVTIYYQVDFELSEVPANAAYFCAQYRRAESVGPSAVYTILDGVVGRGQYVGTYLTWETRSAGWWGEGEVKMFIDGDDQKSPTICGTGTEDYFGGSYDFEEPDGKHYKPFNTAYAGLIQVVPADVIYKPGQRFGMYRWHVADPVRFERDLKVTIQALGWGEKGKYRLRGDDGASSVAYWYQTQPHAPFPAIPVPPSPTPATRPTTNP